MPEPSTPESWEKAAEKASKHLWNQPGRLILLVLVTLNTATTIFVLSEHASPSQLQSLNQAMQIDLLVIQTDVFSILMYGFFVWALMPTILALGTLAKFGYRRRGADG